MTLWPKFMRLERLPQPPPPLPQAGDPISMIYWRLERLSHQQLLLWHHMAKQARWNACLSLVWMLLSLLWGFIAWRTAGWL